MLFFTSLFPIRSLQFTALLATRAFLHGGTQLDSRILLLHLMIHHHDLLVPIGCALGYFAGLAALSTFCRDRGIGIDGGHFFFILVTSAATTLATFALFTTHRHFYSWYTNYTHLKRNEKFYRRGCPIYPILLTRFNLWLQVARRQAERRQTTLQADPQQTVHKSRLN